MTTYIIMGVAGCGKSTIGKQAAQQLDLPFLEGDDFHPAYNKQKIRSGAALSPEDRLPWIDAITDHILTQGNSQNRVLACSALSKAVRSRLRGALNGDCEFLHLHGDRLILKQRLTARQGHMFGPDLLPSQFTALQMPRRAARFGIDQDVQTLCDEVCAHIRTHMDAKP